MSSEILKPMDVYSSRMDIPFDVAAYCRGHKLSVEAVNYARAIRNVEECKKQVKLAEDRLAAGEHGVKLALAAVRAKMERDPA